MISYIRGTVEFADDSGAVIGCNGIGYYICAPTSVLQKLAAGTEAKVLTHMQVKEDGITLFGFLTNEELSVFRRLLGVTGVGPKAAVSLLSALTPSQIMLAVVTDDIKTLTRAPGIGKKVAGRIALELKDKIAAADYGAGEAVNPQLAISIPGTPKQEAIEALSALGYSRSEAVKAVMEVAVEGLDTESIIKLALKKLSKSY